MQRLFLRSRLREGSTVDLDRGQANYLTNVLRLRPGDAIHVFNGTDGEWRASLMEQGRRNWSLKIEALERQQTQRPELQYLFAPLKHARLDYMVQKAVEMGAGRLVPVLTQHGQVSRVNLERMEANAIEAAEQCGILTIPDVDAPVALAKLIETWSEQSPVGRIVFCDETATGTDPVETLRNLSDPVRAVLIGPEGGFSEQERELLNAQSFVTAIGLGPRIMRADTAAVAALAVVQAVVGDWRGASEAD